MGFLANGCWPGRVSLPWDAANSFGWSGWRPQRSLGSEHFRMGNDFSMITTHTGECTGMKKGSYQFGSSSTKTCFQLSNGFGWLNWSEAWSDLWTIFLQGRRGVTCEVSKNYSLQGQLFGRSLLSDNSTWSRAGQTLYGLKRASQKQNWTWKGSERSEEIFESEKQLNAYIEATTFFSASFFNFQMCLYIVYTNNIQKIPVFKLIRAPYSAGGWVLGACQLGKAHRNLGDPVWARNNFPQPQDPGAWIVDELEKNRAAWRGRCKDFTLCDDDTVWASGMCLLCITFEQQQPQEQEQKEHDKISKISTPATRATPAAIAATTRTKTIARTRTRGE